MEKLETTIRVRQSKEKIFKENCKHCMFYSQQTDRNGGTAITYCSHTKNKNDQEGNTTLEDCPIENIQ